MPLKCLFTQRIIYAKCFHTNAGLNNFLVTWFSFLQKDFWCISGTMNCSSIKSLKLNCGLGIYKTYLTSSLQIYETRRGGRGVSLTSEWYQQTPVLSSSSCHLGSPSLLTETNCPVLELLASVIDEVLSRSTVDLITTWNILPSLLTELRMENMFFMTNYVTSFNHNSSQGATNYPPSIFNIHIYDITALKTWKKCGFSKTRH